MLWTNADGRVNRRCSHSCPGLSRITPRRRDSRAAPGATVDQLLPGDAKISPKAQFSPDAGAIGINDEPVRALANALRTTRSTFIVFAIL